MRLHCQGFASAQAGFRAFREILAFNLSLKVTPSSPEYLTRKSFILNAEAEIVTPATLYEK